MTKSKAKTTDLIAPITYSNEYGELVLTAVTGYMPVSSISIDKLPVIEQHMFSIDDAETIALITENHNVQFSTPYLLKMGHPRKTDAYIIHHQSSTIACVCKVEIKTSIIESGLSAQGEIERIYQDSSQKLKAQYNS